jgi:hypothetical protein
LSTSDPIEMKNQKLTILHKEMQEKVEKLIDATKKVNQAKDKAEEIIQKMLIAVKLAEKEYVDFINEMGIIKISIKEDK